MTTSQPSAASTRMVAAFTAPERVEALTDEFPTLSVAAYNGANTVLSGPADDLAQPFSMDLEHLGVDRTGELSEPEPSARPTTVEQEQRPLGWLFRGV